MTGTDIAFVVFAGTSVVSAWRVFAADSMVRAAYWLMVSFIAVGLVMILLNARFLGLVLVLMMGGEMTIMAVFMVMFMMNPAGLNPMTMVHQNRTAKLAGFAAFVALAGVGLVARFPDRPAPARSNPTPALGTELLGNSMLIMQTAGATLLTTMVGAVALASKRGRFGEAQEGSVAPDLEAGHAAPAPPATPEPPAARMDHDMGDNADMDVASDGMAGMDHG